MSMDGKSSNSLQWKFTFVQSMWGSKDTYQLLAVEQRCAAASSDGPVAEVEHMVDLLGQLSGVLMLSHKPHTAFFGNTLDRK